MHPRPRYRKPYRPVVGARLWTLMIVCALAALPARGQEARHFRLAAAPEIIESGLIARILPRFMLKTGRRGEIVGPGAAPDVMPDVLIAAAPDGPGRAVMQRGGVVYRLHVGTGNDAARRFAD